jgi:hypothetical protein
VLKYVCALHEFDMSCICDMHIGAHVGAKSYALYKEVGATIIVNSRMPYTKRWERQGFLSESSRNGRVPMWGVSDVMEIVCLIQRGGSGRDRMPYTKRW